MLLVWMINIHLAESLLPHMLLHLSKMSIWEFNLIWQTKRTYSKVWNHTMYIKVHGKKLYKCKHNGT